MGVCLFCGQIIFQEQGLWEDIKGENCCPGNYTGENKNSIHILGASLSYSQYPVKEYNGR